MFSEAKTQEFQNGSGVVALDSVRVAGPLDERAAIGIVQMGFSSDPIARWAYPDADTYLSVFPEFIRAFAGRAMRSSTAYLTRDDAGAALWLPPGVEPDEDELMEVVRSTVPQEIHKDLFDVMDQMGTFHPQEPHWYLPMIAVDPIRQGRGMGSKLMKFVLERCDEDDLPAYLESSNPRNISLYQRFGFEVVGLIRSGGSPPMFPMYRERRSNRVSTNRGGR